MRLTPSTDAVAAAAANTLDALFGGGLADLRRTPAAIIDEGPQRTVYRYVPARRRAPRGSPVLLVPPLAAPSRCFDLRRGCSLAEHLLGVGRRAYLVEYGDIGFSDRDLGLEHWVEDVLPTAVASVSHDAGGAPVHLVGWCLGGIMSALAVAAADLPVASLSLVASPFDFDRGGTAGVLRPVTRVTGGVLETALYRVLGGAPAPLVRWGYRLAGIEKQLTKPLAVLTHLDDREFLAQLEAVDHFMDNMHAYPGRTFGQLYHRFFRVNELADGRIDLGREVVDLAAIDVPVLAVAGRDDGLAPVAGCHHVAALLPGAPEVRLELAPGGHLGVLTGRAAPRTTWALIDRFLAAHDEPAAVTSATAA